MLVGGMPMRAARAATDTVLKQRRQNRHPQPHPNLPLTADSRRDMRPRRDLAVMEKRRMRAAD